jgi:hypothetical protein
MTLVFVGWPRGSCRREALGVSLGRDETLGSQAGLVKSGRPAPRPGGPRIPAADGKGPARGASVTVVSRAAPRQSSAEVPLARRIRGGSSGLAHRNRPGCRPSSRSAPSAGLQRLCVAAEDRRGAAEDRQVPAHRITGSPPRSINPGAGDATPSARHTRPASRWARHSPPITVRQPRASHAAPWAPQDARRQLVTTSTPATVRLPLRSTRNRP